MSGFPFSARFRRGPEQVYYNCGQGIGFYSSWTSMAFLHHLLVRLAAYRVGIKNFTDYLVLGDDVVIASELVRTEYVRLMESIGISISKAKTVTPSPAQGIEFASKLLCSRGNISPLPVGCLFDQTVSSLFQLWDALHDRRVSLGETRNVSAPDLGILFPLRKGRGHRELSTY